MGSVIDVCNRALGKIGQPRITSLLDNNKAAKACNHAFEFVRDRFLRSHVWNFTIKRSILAPLGTTPAHTYIYEYQLPADSIRILQVDTTYDWIVEGRKILTDEGDELRVVYQCREEDTNQYDTMAFETLAALLAYELCEELTQSNTKKQEAFRDYRETFRMAKMFDAQEGSPSTFVEDDWVNIRF